MKYLTLAAISAALIATAAHAVLPDEQLADPVLEARAREISKGLRCVVCQNQSIDDSDAPLARDLRLIVREQLAAGKSDRETVDYLVERYGNFVLLKPPLEGATIALWAGPFVILAGGLLGVAAYVRRRRPVPTARAAGLDDDEQKQLDRLLGGE